MKEKTVDEEAAAYQSYLLRVWRVDNGGQPVWRYTLQPAAGGPPEIFCAPDELVTFLEGTFLQGTFLDDGRQERTGTTDDQSSPPVIQ